MDEGNEFSRAMFRLHLNAPDTSNFPILCQSNLIKSGPGAYPYCPAGIIDQNIGRTIIGK